MVAVFIDNLGLVLQSNREIGTVHYSMYFLRVCTVATSMQLSRLACLFVGLSTSARKFVLVNKFNTSHKDGKYSEYIL